MNPHLRENQELLSDVDIHYGPGTRPQVPLPFSIWVRRKYWWWPGPERYSGLVDRLIMAVLMTPGVIWAFLSFGWIPIIFILLEAVIICEIFYRVATGTMLGD